MSGIESPLNRPSDLLVWNKKSGQSCFVYRDHPERESVLEEMFRQHPTQKQFSWPDNFAGGIAHRLDVPTSGQLLIARSIEQLEELRGLFAQKKMLKTYYFLSHKKVSWSQHQVQNAIGHDRRKKKKMVIQRGEQTAHRGKWYCAKTRFEKIAENDDCTLWKAQMQTGVMHQIRIHAAFAGIALWGDTLYGGGQKPDFFPSDFALHHWGIEFPKSTSLPKSFTVPNPIPLPSWWPKWTRQYILG